MKKVTFSDGFQLAVASLSLMLPALVQGHGAHEDWHAEAYPLAKQHVPTPIPDRVVLTWNDDPATTQAVTWRTDTTVMHGVAEFAVANANGRALRLESLDAETEYFKSDLNEAHYHSVTFRDLKPDTLYTYRVGDGENWSELYHFKTASTTPEPFTFIYFGDA